MDPIVSIGLPVYNGENFVAEAIESVLAQTYEAWELIISDNCSSDGTEAICRRYADAEDRIRYVRQAENLGALPNFNSVVAQARGSYFKWCAHDDLMLPTFLERCMERLQADPGLAWVHARSDMIDEQHRSFLTLLPPDDEHVEPDGQGGIKWKGVPRPDMDSSDPVARFRSVILGTNWCVDIYGVFPLDQLRQTRLIESYYGSEKVLLGELALRGRYEEIPETLFFKRVHEAASANLKSSSEQSDFVGRKQTRSRMPARLAILLGHLGSVRRTPLTPWQRLRGYGVVLRYLCQVQKLKKVLMRMIRGEGTGGGGRRLMQAAQRTSTATRGASTELGS